jgi:hypothetical protein
VKHSANVLYNEKRDVNVHRSLSMSFTCWRMRKYNVLVLVRLTVNYKLGIASYEYLTVNYGALRTS